MSHRHRLLTAVAAAALLALPALAQPNNTSSMQPQATQTMPQQGPVGGQPAVGAGAATGGSGNPTTGTVQGAQGGVPARTTSPDRVQTPNMPPAGRATAAPNPNPAAGSPQSPPGTGTTPGTAPRMNAPAPAAPSLTQRTAEGALGNRTPDSTTLAQAAPPPAAPSLAVDAGVLREGRRASRLIGSAVYNDGNDSVGEVDDLLIPPRGGAPVAIISVGGFLGIGAKLVAVPYERLQHNPERNRWILTGATRDGLNALPTFTYESESRRG